MAKTSIFPGADERTPSRAQYFSWINHTNEGPTEAQTLANLGFFQYLHDEYGMVLDIYAFDAGAIDGAKFYGSTDSERFRRQFPRGFAPLADAAQRFGARLGVWGGPDGFGETDADARKRIETMVALCRDHAFALFKMDAVCGQLRKDKQDPFVEMMTQCREHSPDLILLNHRLDLGKGLDHATTFLWEGAETYIDVHMVNTAPASHSRACALGRGLPPKLVRLTEDHGVCLSSCLDYWEDDLVLQAFNRCLILAPEIYGNPWLLRDDELPRLARIYNLHRRYREILVDGTELPEAQLGPSAVSRGDERTRLVTLRNLTWEPIRRAVKLDKTIGLRTTEPVEVRRLHPHERVLGKFEPGDSVEVEVLPFRSLLLLATSEPIDEPAVVGCDYDLVQDVPGRPARLKLLGEPGSAAEIRVVGPRRSPAALDGERVELATDGSLRVEFAGAAPTSPWHRKLGDLEPADVPDDAEALYEATCFAADSNALEIRELERSGPTNVEAVRQAREAFLNQPTFRRRHLWDRCLFDDDSETAFAVGRRWGEMRVRGGAFRLDLGEPTRIDRLVLEVDDDYDLQPLKNQEGVWGSVSADLKTWRRVGFFAHPDIAADLPDEPIRYVRLDGCPDRVRHVRGFRRGEALDRTKWRASNLLGRYQWAPAERAWAMPFTLDQARPGAYLAIAIHGQCGRECAYAALRVGDHYAGAPRRSPSFPSNTWECPVRQTDGNCTYYIPVTETMVGEPLEAVVLLLKGGDPDIRVEAWLTAYPIPYASRELVLE
jgi:hypothetical protein